MRRRNLPMLGFLLLLAGCIGPGPRTAYPPDRRLELAPVQRQAFVQAFLQGRWCEAESRFYASNERYLQQDDFCGVAYNHELFWKLKGYLGLKAPEHLEEARALRNLGLPCPGGDSQENHVPSGGEGDMPPRDRAYRDLLKRKDYQGLFERLSGEKNPLFASVYARKGAETALGNGETAWAGRFAMLARDLDAQRGWVVFLLEDWRLLERLSRDPGRRDAIRRRISRLKDLIRPCER